MVVKIGPLFLRPTVQGSSPMHLEGDAYIII